MVQNQNSSHFKYFFFFAYQSLLIKEQGFITTQSCMKIEILIFAINIISDEATLTIFFGPQLLQWAKFAQQEKMTFTCFFFNFFLRHAKKSRFSFNKSRMDSISVNKKGKKCKKCTIRKESDLWDFFSEITISRFSTLIFKDSSEPLPPLPS